MQHNNIHLSLQPNRVARVWANPAEVQQIIRNLLLNAVDAGASNIELRLEERPDSVSLHVEDDGSGMTPEVSARVYEPFFTTKGVGKGSGLGLSSALQLVQQHEGSLTHRSQKGQGSTFSLTLPREGAR